MPSVLGWHDFSATLLTRQLQSVIFEKRGVRKMEVTDKMLVEYRESVFIPRRDRYPSRRRKLVRMLIEGVSELLKNGFPPEWIYRDYMDNVCREEIACGCMRCESHVSHSQRSITTALRIVMKEYCKSRESSAQSKQD